MINNKIEKKKEKDLEEIKKITNISQSFKKVKFWDKKDDKASSSDISTEPLEQTSTVKETSKKESIDKTRGILYYPLDNYNLTSESTSELLQRLRTNKILEKCLFFYDNETDEDETSGSDGEKDETSGSDDEEGVNNEGTVGTVGTVGTDVTMDADINREKDVTNP